MYSCFIGLTNFGEFLVNTIKTGTTTVGIVLKDGVVLASDQKASMGHLNYDEEVRKVFPISDSVAVTIAGSVGDALTIVRYLKSQARLFEMEKNMSMTPRAAATLLSNILNGNRYYPYLVQLIIGGISKKPILFDLDPAGGLLEKKRYAVTGSGTELALSSLDENFRENLSEEDGVRLAVKAIQAAKKRDVFSGGLSINVVIITQDGLKELTPSDVQKYLA